MMRRQIKLMGWLFVSALAACTSEAPNPADGGNAAENVQKLVINLSEGGDRLTTRAGRPLHSSEPGQWIQNVTLYVTNEKGIVLQKEIDEYVWANAVDYSNGKQLEIAFRASEGEQLPKGDYTVYAVAFSSPTDYSISPAPKAERKINAISGDRIDESKVCNFDFTKNFAAVLNSGKTDAEEIFAGKATVVSTTDANDKPCLTANETDGKVPANDAVITLNRQVAGTIGYFTNIPARVGDAVPTRIRLVAANRSDKVWFTNMITGETETTTDKKDVSWVINGSQSATLPKNAYYYGSDKTTYDAYEIYSIDLSQWFKFDGTDGRTTFVDCDLNNDGYVGKEDADKYIKASSNISNFWENPNATTEQQLEAGSVFAGRFLIPFSLVSGKETFELQLLGNEMGKSEQILKSWRVKVSADGKHDVTDVEVPTGVIVPAADQDYVYNIYRNHMYSIGKKTADVAIEGDDPADLNTAQDLVITVNSQWQIVHGMELEPATTQP
ncbi:hypothetical protein [Phocaeicola coprophilus]|uniref:hypothetical protein n=1 Tax=Phocaeicola coprophilus TaxID=387090 RepID=UPI00255C6681|nr:hypothetical protein [Phocaeicola coprophilus]